MRREDRGWAAGAVATWAVGVLGPSLFIAISGRGSNAIGADAQRSIMRLYGREIAAYLGFAPPAFITYALALLVSG